MERGQGDVQSLKKGSPRGGPRLRFRGARARARPRIETLRPRGRPSNFDKTM